MTTVAAARRVRGPVLFGLVVLVGVVLLTLVSIQKAPDRALDPNGTGPSGAGALLEVMRQHGIRVEVVTTMADLDAALRSPGPTTVAVGNGDYVDAGVLSQVIDRARGTAAAVVVLDPNRALARALPGQLTADLTPSPASPLTPACQSGFAGPADEVAMFQTRISTATTTPDLTLCYPLPAPDDGSPADRGAGLVIVAAAADRPEVRVVGFPQALTNRFITTDAHAGLAVRLLGDHPHLIWYDPDITELGTYGDPGSTTDDSPWPQSTEVVALLLGVAWILYAVVRGRRLGRLVPEPLPVVVRAIETTRSRGELYRRAGDRGRAASALREGTTARLRRRLGLTSADGIPALVEATARATGTPAPEVADLLTGPTPTSDSSLTTLAQALTTLEEKV